MFLKYYLNNIRAFQQVHIFSNRQKCLALDKLTPCYAYCLCINVKIRTKLFKHIYLVVRYPIALNVFSPFQNNNSNGNNEATTVVKVVYTQQEEVFSTFTFLF